MHVRLRTEKRTEKDMSSNIRVQEIEMYIFSYQTQFLRTVSLVRPSCLGS